MEEVIIVGMADLKVAKAPQKIVTLGLGSCVGVCMYDPIRKIGGMVHVMLPTSSMARDVVNRAKFADTGIPYLIEEMRKLGADSARLQVKIAGGAQMFSMAGQNNCFTIGNKNITAVEETCAKMNLTIIAQSVGGNSGKSITLDLENGSLQVKTLNQGIAIL